MTQVLPSALLRDLRTARATETIPTRAIEFPGALGLRRSAAGSSQESDLEGALLSDEGARTRTMAMFGILATLVVGVAIALVPGDPIATVVHHIGLSLGFLASVVVLLQLRLDSAPYRPRLTVLLGVAVAIAALSGFYYWGMFSAAIIVAPIGALLLGQSRSKSGAFLIGALFVVGHVTITCLVISGVLAADRAFNPIGDRPLQVQLLRLTVVQVILIATFAAARRVRHSAHVTMRRLDAALRAIAQRDALLVEAARDRQEALSINIAGRYTNEVLGQFKLGLIIGRGAMGVVYEAVDVSTGAEAALKVLHPHVLANPEQFRRFRREMEIAQTIDDPHVVRVLEAPADDALFPYLAMERLQGVSLSDHLSIHQALSASEVVEMVAQIGAGLRAAHRLGIVHRDLKPRNVFRLERPQEGVRWKVLDFGICKPVDDGATLTELGHVLGTPAYMAPEQARGARVDYRADLYALGAVAYRALTGRPAFSKRDVPELLHDVVYEHPPRPSSLTSYGRDVDHVFALVLAKRACDRFDSIPAFVSALEAALAGRVDPALRARALALAAAKPQ